MKIEFAGGDMKVAEIIKTAILASDKQQKEVAEKMGWSPQSFANRLKKGTIDADEWVDIAHILGYELKMVAQDGSSIQPKRRGFGPRVQQMVDGYAYDTEKADAICRTPKVAGGSFELYRDLTSKQFYIVIYCDWGSQNGIVTPVTDDEAREFYDGCGGMNADTIFA